MPQSKIFITVEPCFRIQRATAGSLNDIPGPGYGLGTPATSDDDQQQVLLTGVAAYFNMPSGGGGGAHRFATSAFDDFIATGSTIPLTDAAGHTLGDATCSVSSEGFVVSCLMDADTAEAVCETDPAVVLHYEVSSATMAPDPRRPGSGAVIFEVKSCTPTSATVRPLPDGESQNYGVVSKSYAPGGRSSHRAVGEKRREYLSPEERQAKQFAVAHRAQRDARYWPGSTIAEERQQREIDTFIYRKRWGDNPRIDDQVARTVREQLRIGGEIERRRRR